MNTAPRPHNRAGMPSASSRPPWRTEQKSPKRKFLRKLTAQVTESSPLRRAGLRLMGAELSRKQPSRTRTRTQRASSQPPPVLNFEYSQPPPAAPPPSRPASVVSAADGGSVRASVVMDGSILPKPAVQAHVLNTNDAPVRPSPSDSSVATAPHPLDPFLPSLPPVPSAPPALVGRGRASFFYPTTSFRGPSRPTTPRRGVDGASCIDLVTRSEVTKEDNAQNVYALRCTAHEAITDYEKNNPSKFYELKKCDPVCVVRNYLPTDVHNSFHKSLCNTFGTKETQLDAGFNVLYNRSDRTVRLRSADEADGVLGYSYDSNPHAASKVADWELYDHLLADPMIQQSKVNLSVENLYNFHTSGQGMSLHNDAKYSPSLSTNNRVFIYAGGSGATHQIYDTRTRTLVVEHYLPPNSLLILPCGFFNYYDHAVVDIDQPRFSLTLRHHYPNSNLSQNRGDVGPIGLVHPNPRQVMREPVNRPQKGNSRDFYSSQQGKQRKFSRNESAQAHQATAAQRVTLKQSASRSYTPLPKKPPVEVPLGRVSQPGHSYSGNSGSQPPRSAASKMPPNRMTRSDRAPEKVPVRGQGQERSVSRAGQPRPPGGAGQAAKTIVLLSLGEGVTAKAIADWIGNDILAIKDSWLISARRGGKYCKVEFSDKQSASRALPLLAARLRESPLPDSPRARCQFWVTKRPRGKTGKQSSNGFVAASANSAAKKGLMTRSQWMRAMLSEFSAVPPAPWSGGSGGFGDSGNQQHW